MVLYLPAGQAQPLEPTVRDTCKTAGDHAEIRSRRSRHSRAFLARSGQNMGTVLCNVIVVASLRNVIVRGAGARVCIA